MQDQVVKVVRALYYRYGFDRDFPGKNQVISLVDDWERRHHRGDSPKGADAWDRQYAAGEWDYMGRLEESSHYSVILGYLSYLAQSGSVLDVGCGDGVLFHRMRPQGYGRYVGVDISDVAIQTLTPHADERTAFLQGDGDTFEPNDSYDAIVFNESLYYFRDPLAAVQRYADHLNPNGVLIVSLYQESRRAAAITAALQNRFRVLDTTMVMQGSHTWQCLVIRPAAAGKTASGFVASGSRVANQGALMLSSVGSEIAEWGAVVGLIA